MLFLISCNEVANPDFGTIVSCRNTYTRVPVNAGGLAIGSEP